MEYSLSKLNAREFESLSADIISSVLNLNVEKFKAGKDGGADGRFWIGDKEGIIQCKHYWKTGYHGLISKLKNEEVKKVKNVNPARYIFFTSVPLSRKNKKEIFKIFTPFIKSETDVWGEDDIDDFLSKKENQKIVEKNYKLWITSTRILDILLHNAIKGRSESTIKEIESHIDRYVITKNHIKGTEILKKNNVIIISGEPGIGKTTLANNLALYYIANGFEFCDIEESISEAEDLFIEKEHKKIIFYCDDFLGSNMYDAISNKRDSHIVKFINRIKNDKSKKFILTSRTNILTKAVSLSHQFQNKKIREDEFLLKIENISNLDKARILYNHIYHSDIDNRYIDEIYKGKRYKEIIRHRNFNPRIIEFITDYKRVSNIKSEEYWNYIINKLENPEDIWRDYFQNQIDESVRILSFLTVFNGGKIEETGLRRSYSTYKDSYNIQMDHTDSSFNAVRRLAIKSLLNRSQLWNGNFEYSLFNPSVGDFILNAYLEDVNLVISMLKSLGTCSSIKFLDSLQLNKRIAKGALQQIQFELFKIFFNPKLKDENWDYLILLSYLDINNSRTKNFIKELIKEISQNSESEGERLAELLFLLIEFDDIIEIQDFDFVLGFMENKEIDSDDIDKLTELIEKYKIQDEYFIEKYIHVVNSYLKDALDDNKSSIDIGQHIRFYSYMGNEDVDVDYDGINSELESLLDSIISDFDYKFLNNIYINHADIIATIDIDQEIADYTSSFVDDYEDDFSGRTTADSDSESDIDVIFERN